MAQSQKILFCEAEAGFTVGVTHAGFQAPRIQYFYENVNRFSIFIFLNTYIYPVDKRHTSQNTLRFINFLGIIRFSFLEKQIIFDGGRFGINMNSVGDPVVPFRIYSFFVFTVPKWIYGFNNNIADGFSVINFLFGNFFPRFYRDRIRFATENKTMDEFRELSFV